jgi:hypothetical protein
MFLHLFLTSTLGIRGLVDSGVGLNVWRGEPQSVLWPTFELGTSQSLGKCVINQTAAFGQYINLLHCEKPRVSFKHCEVKLASFVSVKYQSQFTK